MPLVVLPPLPLQMRPVLRLLLLPLPCLARLVRPVALDRVELLAPLVILPPPLPLLMRPVLLLDLAGLLVPLAALGLRGVTLRSHPRLLLSG